MKKYILFILKKLKKNTQLKYIFFKLYIIGMKLGFLHISSTYSKHIYLYFKLLILKTHRDEYFKKPILL